MDTKEISAWGEFEGVLEEISQYQQHLTMLHRRSFTLLYRGLGSADWGLQTTLERAHPLEMHERIDDIKRYYEHVTRGQSAIETLTEMRWDQTPDFIEALKAFDEHDPQRFFSEQVEIYRYLIYLRHHGYPSPLLDWTASPYIAAFFAFDAMPASADKVSVYVALRDSTYQTGSAVQMISLLGPYVRAHKRHIVQQCRYTVCTRGTHLESHDQAITQKGAFGIEGEVIKIEIPATARSLALKRLDLMNITPYSLYGSDESLMRTICRREGLFRHFPN